MSLAAIVRGTASKLGGGKFANGAVSGAFVHMYNWTAHVSASGSLGGLKGGTEEGGWVIAHDSKQPWYRGWDLGVFTTSGRGLYGGIGASAELNVGFSWNDDIYAMERTSLTTGGSGGVIFDGGYELSTGNNVEPVSNVSLGVGLSPIPVEVHRYDNLITTVQSVF